MVTEDKFGLRPLWDASLEIYRVVETICGKHGLRCFATDGTALGAIRHKGYIPWDDDLDISMPRPDYEVFLKVAKDELPEYLKIVNWQNTSEFNFLFAKVQDTRRDIVESIESKLGHQLSNGIFIDVFPIDGYPEGLFERCRVVLIDKMLSQISFFMMKSGMKSKKNTLKNKLKLMCGYILSHIFRRIKTHRDILMEYEKLGKRYRFNESRFTGRMCSSHTVLRRAPLKKNIWGIPQKIEFHDTFINVPEDLDAHLRNEYYKWDYMQLPPEKDRHPTHTYDYRCPWWLGPTKK